MSKKEDKPQGDGKEITSDYAEKAVADLARLLAREQIKQHQPIVTIGLVYWQLALLMFGTSLLTALFIKLLT